MRVLGPWDPGVADALECRRHGHRLLDQRFQVGVFDLPAAGHLLNHELGVHSHVDLGGADLGRLLEARDQAAILGDVVGGVTDRLLALGQHGFAVGRPDHRAVARGPGIAPRSAVGLDDDLH